MPKRQWQFMCRTPRGDLNATAMAHALSDTQKDCLRFWPNPYFQDRTKWVLRAARLVIDSCLTPDGARVLMSLGDKIELGWTQCEACTAYYRNDRKHDPAACNSIARRLKGKD